MSKVPYFSCIFIIIIIWSTKIKQVLPGQPDLAEKQDGTKDLIRGSNLVDYQTDSGEISGVSGRL